MDLLDGIAALRNSKEVGEVFRDLFTYQELLMISHRIRIAELLQKGKGYRWVKEFPGTKEDIESIPTDGIDVSIFEEGDKVQISGISKGKGFQGGVKRWGMHGRNASHGVKHEERTIGSIGDAGVAKVFKGKKMPGHMGVDRVTVRKVKVVQVNKEENMLAVKGAVPGRLGTLLEIKG